MQNAYDFHTRLIRSHDTDASVLPPRQGGILLVENHRVGVTALFCDRSRRPLLRGKKQADTGSGLGTSHIDSEPLYKERSLVFAFAFQSPP